MTVSQEVKGQGKEGTESQGAQCNWGIEEGPLGGCSYC